MRSKNVTRTKKLLFVLLIISFISALGSGCGLKKATQEDIDELAQMAVSENLEGDSNVTKVQKSYEIAVVFDNSGSMYRNKAWSRAKYAMEIFGSMLNYEDRGPVPGDVLKVFPMWEVTTDGSRPEKGSGEESLDPIVIKSIADLDKIHNMYTVNALGTPYQPVKDAYEELEKSKADEKWLFVLTDGAFDDIKTSKLGKRLSKLANENIKVQYLGIGDADNLSKYENEFFFTKKSSSSDTLKENIVAICNQIFQRDTLPQSALKGDQLTLDMSMRNIIVFVQGTDAKVNKLVDSQGRKVTVLSDSKQRKYSDLGAANYPKAKTDQELAGQLISFVNCPKGTYTLDYKDAESIQVFYEPNIDIKLTFSDANGKEIDMTGKKENLYPGEFKLKYSLFDSVTEEDVTSSPLLGNVWFEGGVLDSKGNFTEVKNNGVILLEPDEATFLQATGHYLDSYTITTADRKADYTVLVGYPPIASEIEITQKKSWYELKHHDEWEPIIVHLSIDGEEVSDTQLKKTQLLLDIEPEIAYRAEPLEGQSAFAVNLGEDSDGKYVKPDTGKYSIKAAATYLDQDTESIPNRNKDTDHFKVKNYPQWLLWLLIVLGILLLLGLIYWWMMHPTFPESMYLKSGTNTYPYDVRKKGMSLSSRLFASELTCQAKPKSPHMDRKGQKAKVEISHISGPGVKEFTIGNKTFVKDSSGNFVGPSSKVLKPEDKFTLKNNTVVSWKYGDKRRSGTITFSRKAGGKKGKAGKRR